MGCVGASPTRRDDLERRLAVNYAKEGYGEVQLISDVGPGVNESFLKLLEMVSRGRPRIIVAYEAYRV